MYRTIVVRTQKKYFSIVQPLRSIREDTDKKSFFSGRTTKGVGRVNPPDH